METKISNVSRISGSHMAHNIVMLEKWKKALDKEKMCQQYLWISQRLLIL